MSSSVAFGTILSANRQFNHEFNKEQKAVMCAEIYGGKTYRAVARDWGTGPSTVYKIFKRWKAAQSLEKKPRSGRPAKLTKAEIRYITLLIKRNR